MTPEPADTFEHAGLTVHICWEEYVDDSDNPRTNCDGNIGVMFCDHRGYTLGDEDAPDPREQRGTCPTCDGSGDDPSGKYIVANYSAFGWSVEAVDFPDEATATRYMHRHAPEGANWGVQPQSCPKCEGEGEIELSIVAYLMQEHGARVILPLFVYEHGGITMRCGGRLDTGEDNFRRGGRFAGDGAGWDTSSVGVIFDTADTRKECGQEDASNESIERQLREEVHYYDMYLTNQVYGYEVIGPDGEVMGSCWGFLESNIWSADSSVRQEAMAGAEGCAREVEREREEAFAWACRDVETVR